MYYVLLLLLLCCSFILTTKAGTPTKNVNCEVVEKIWWLGWINTEHICSISNLNVKFHKTHFKIVPHQNVNSIRGIRFLYSDLGILTSDFCDALPFVVCFDTRQLGLVRIDNDVFEKCSDLEQVDLSRNRLENVPKHLFDWNEKLKFVFLNNNHLTEIDVNLFKYNQNLMYLNLNNNRLRSLPRHVFDHNPQLTYLRLANNELGNIAFLFQMPVMTRLQWVHLERNKLWRPEHEAHQLREKFPNLNQIRI